MLVDLVLTAEGRTSASLWMEIAIINACIHSCMQNQDPSLVLFFPFY